MHGEELQVFEDVVDFENCTVYNEGLKDIVPELPDEYRRNWSFTRHGILRAECTEVQTPSGPARAVKIDAGKYEVLYVDYGRGIKLTIEEGTVAAVVGEKEKYFWSGEPIEEMYEETKKHGHRIRKKVLRPDDVIHLTEEQIQNSLAVLKHRSTTHVWWPRAPVNIVPNYMLPVLLTYGAVGEPVDAVLRAYLTRETAKLQTPTGHVTLYGHRGAYSRTLGENELYTRSVDAENTKFHIMGPTGTANFEARRTGAEFTAHIPRECIIKGPLYVAAKVHGLKPHPAYRVHTFFSKTQEPECVFHSKKGAVIVREGVMLPENALITAHEEGKVIGAEGRVINGILFYIDSDGEPFAVTLSGRPIRINDEAYEMAKAGINPFAT